MSSAAQIGSPMLPPSGDQPFIENSGRSCGVKFQPTIFCRSKVSLPRCEPHSAARGSPWELLECVLEMLGTLTRDEPDESIVNICIKNIISLALHIYKEKAKIDVMIACIKVLCHSNKALKAEILASLQWFLFKHFRF